VRVYEVTHADVPVLGRNGIEPKTSRNAAVVALFEQGLTGAEIGRRIGITRERVRQIVYRDAQLRLRRPSKEYRCRLCGGAYTVETRRDHTRTAAHAESFERRRVAKFWRRVVPRPDGCWDYTGCHDPNGYSKAFIFGLRYAHRVAYFLTYGPIPDGLNIDHLCRNRGCCNPAHLEAVTQRENIMRSPIAPAAINARKTHCKRGHAYAGENVRLTTNPRTGRSARSCRTCERDGERRRSALRRTAA
jgi:DNA-binding CsgD family transcriptional regulator